MVTAGVVAAALVVALPPTAAALPAQDPELVSVRTDGAQGTPAAAAQDAAVSADGRYVAFASAAGLDPGAAPGVLAVYVRDRLENRTVLLSGGIADGASAHPAISADGRYVAFDTGAGPGRTAVVVADRDPDGDGVPDEPLPSGAPDLRYTTMPADGTRSDTLPSLSADAGTIAWSRSAGFGEPDVVTAALARDAQGRLAAPDAVRVLRPASDGTTFFEAGAGRARVSADGTRVLVPVKVCEFFCGSAFAPVAHAAPFVGPPVQNALYVADLPGGTMSRVDDPVIGDAGAASLSADGREIAYLEGTPPALRVVTRAPDGTPVSKTTVATPAPPVVPELSADGRYLAYAATDPDGRVLVRDLRVDAERAAAGLPPLPDEAAATRTCRAQGTPCAAVPAATSVGLSADGSVVVFDSAAEDLVPGDGNGAADVFARPFRPEARADAVDFGVTDEPVTRTVTVRHTGFGPLRVGAVSTGGAFDVHPAQNCGGVVLYETGECVISVRFTPPAPGTAVTGELTITTGTGVVAVPLRGARGPAPVAALSVSPAELVFPGERLALTPSPPAEVVLLASGTAPLTIRDIGPLAGPGLYPGDYVPDGACTGVVLPAGTSCTIRITSIPRGGGPRPGALLITTDDPAGPLIVGLTATGVRPAVTAVPSVTAAGRVTTLSGSGFPPDQQLALTAPGLTPTLRTDAAGRFSVPMVVLQHAVPGAVRLRVTGPPDTDLTTETTLLITGGTYQPPGLLSRR